MKSIKNYLSNFINSTYFPLVAAGVGVVSFLLGIQLIGFVFTVIFGVYTLLTQKNTLPVIPLFLCFYISIRDFDHLLNLAVLIPLAVPILFAFVFHLILFPVKFKLGKLFIPFAIYTFVTFLGGIGSPYLKYYFESFANLLISGLIPFLVYVYFYITLDSCDDVNIKEYFLKTYFYFAILITIEIILFRFNFYVTILDNGYVSIFQMGWLNTGFGGYFVHFATAICFYMALKCRDKKILFPILTVIFFYVFLLLSENDASLGIELFMLPFVLILMYNRIGKTFKNLIALILIVYVIVLIFGIIFVLTSPSILSKFTKHFLYDTGRGGIYSQCYVLFSSNPILGGGYGGGLHVGNSYLVKFGAYIHSSFLQVLYSTGIIGLIAYIIYFIRRLRIFGEKYTDFNIFMLIAFINYECVAAVGNAEVTILSVVMALFTVCVEIINKGNPDEELPLTKQIDFRLFNAL